MLSLFAALLLQPQPTAPPASLLAEQTAAYRPHAAPACRDWSASRSDKTTRGHLRSFVYELWVSGYVTAFNFVGPDQTGDLLGPTSKQELYSAVDGYCGRNPSRTVNDAMAPIANALIRRRQGASRANIAAGESKKHAIVVTPVTCGDWVHDRSDALLTIAYLDILRGYVTAYNRWARNSGGDAIGSQGGKLIEGALDSWCRDHPSSLIIGAVNPLISHVAAERTAGRFPPAGQ